MFYNIRHLTRFRYAAPVRESLMELRMHPRSEGPQRCLGFEVNVTPRARMQSYRDYLGNVVHHFDVPGPHRQLTITAEAMVDVAPIVMPPFRLDGDAWRQLDSDIAERDFRMMAETGINTIRVFTPPPIWLLDLADDHGLRMLVGVPWSQHVTFLDSPEIEREMQKVLHHAWTHCHDRHRRTRCRRTCAVARSG